MRPGSRLCRSGAIALLAAAALRTDADSAVAAKPSPLDDPALAGKNRYDRCLQAVKRTPARALDEAQDWARSGGGVASLHCEALALAALKRYSGAAQTLEDAAADANATEPALRAQLFDQAGNAWLLAGNAARAEAALSSALALEPNDEDILSDRARGRGAARDWTGAIEDLTAVLAIDPDRADIYVLRASALHAQGRTDEARADIARALDIYPGYPEALLERGTMRFESGDRSGARADWQQAAREAPESAAGAAASARLARSAGVAGKR